MFGILKLTIMLFIFGGLTVFSEEIGIDYLEGYIEVRSGESWRVADIGDQLIDSDLLLLSDDAYVELSLNDVRITIDQGGSYSVLTLVNKIKRSSSWGIRRSAFTRLIFDDSSEGQKSTAMGVRGNVLEGEDVPWIEDDLEFLEEGMALYFEGSYADALPVLSEGALWNGSNINEILFFKALCEFETEKFRDLRLTLNEMDLPSDSDYFQDYVLLKGNQLIEDQKYSEAVALFDRALAVSSRDDVVQSVYLLSAFCSLEQENTDSARSKLQKIIAINPLNETGVRASEILRDL